jgi:hypothetical protein
MLLSNCATGHSYIFKPLDVPQNEMLVYGGSGIKSSIEIVFYINTNQPMENFKYNGGFVQIGEEKISFDSRLIEIFGQETDSKYVIFWELYGRNNITNNTNYARQDKYFNKVSDYRYYFNLSKLFDNEVIDEIKEKGYKNVNIFLEYEMTIGNEIFNSIINEKFVLEINSYRYSAILSLLFHNF